MERIAVIGMSSFGYYLTRQLAELGCEVLALDKDEAAIDKVKDFVAKAVVADATDGEVIEEIGVLEMDAVVLSMGEDLEASIITAMHLRDLGVERIIAKALSEDHVRVMQMLGVKEIVFPERDTGVRLAYSLSDKNVLQYLSFGSDLAVVEMVPLPEMIGRNLGDLDFRNRYGCQVVALRRQGPEASAWIPGAATILKEEHVLVLMGKQEDLAKLIG